MPGQGIPVDHRWPLEDGTGSIKVQAEWKEETHAKRQLIVGNGVIDRQAVGQYY